MDSLVLGAIRQEYMIVMLLILHRLFPNLIDKNNTDLIVDRSKLRRARKRIRSEYENELKVVEPFQALYFDDRKDDTKIHLPNCLFTLVKEEHMYHYFKSLAQNISPI